MNLNLIQKFKRSLTDNIIFKKSKVGGLILSNFLIYCKTTVITTSWYSN